MLCRNEKIKENSQLQKRDMKKSAHHHSSVLGRCRDLCDLGIVTYKRDLNNYSYNCYDYILNLVDRSVGRCPCNRLFLGGS
jgi:hypothetical protein